MNTLFLKTNFIILALLSTISVTGQEIYEEEIIKSNNVKILNSYEMLYKDGEVYDSLLWDTHIFNAQGKLLMVQRIYDNSTTRHEFRYLADTFCIEGRIIDDGILNYTTTYLRNEKSQIVKSININAKGDTMSHYSIYEYYDNGKLKEWKSYYLYGLGAACKYDYHENGEFKTQRYSINFNACITYDERGYIIKKEMNEYKWISDDYAFYENGLPKVYISKYQHKRPGSDSGFKSSAYIKGDIQANVYSYRENGIIKSRMTLKNNKVVSRYNYHYITF